MKQQQQLLSPFHSIHRSREKRAKKEIFFFFSRNQKQFGRFTTSPPSSLGE
jgi:hypothetical protein